MEWTWIEAPHAMVMYIVVIELYTPIKEVLEKVLKT